MIPRRRIHTLSHELAIALRFSAGHTDFPAAEDEFRSAFAQYIGVSHTIAVSSGRRGLDCILDGLGLAAGSEVILPAYTLNDLAVRISHKGLKPVFADIDPVTLTMAPDSVENRISAKTRVIVATHLFGAPCQIDRIMDVASKHRIFVIEDCAHALGSVFSGRKLGSFGNAAFFSFETIKPLNLYGGGMIATNDNGLADKMRAMLPVRSSGSGVPLKKIGLATLERLFLPTPLALILLAPLSVRSMHDCIYGIYRWGQQRSRSSSAGISQFQSYLGLLKLKTLDSRIRSRQANAKILCSMLQDPIRPQGVLPGGESNYYFFVVRVPDRIWQVRRHLLKCGIDAGIEAEIADDCAAAFNDNQCPVTADLFGRTLHLPLHEDMSKTQLFRVADSLNRFYS
jgi:perosamine synthetase